MSNESPYQNLPQREKQEGETIRKTTDHSALREVIES